MTDLDNSSEDHVVCCLSQSHKTSKLSPQCLSTLNRLASSERTDKNHSLISFRDTFVVQNQHIGESNISLIVRRMADLRPDVGGGEHCFRSVLYSGTVTVSFNHRSINNRRYPKRDYHRFKIFVL
jgi:hypothetical protein